MTAGWPRGHYLTIPLAALIGLGGCGGEGAAVEKAVLFSAIDGRVVRGDAPVAGATLVREWAFAEKQVSGRDETVAGADGAFHFPAATFDYRPSRFFAQETIVSQSIRVRADGREWQVWSAAKHNLEPGTESATFPNMGQPSDVPLRVTIDLDSPQEMRGHVVGHTLFAAAP